MQPPDPLELWDSPPFEPVLKNGYVFARGATDNKGQILSHILGIQETIEEHRELPVNLHLVIEGEEEIGSGSLGPFLTENRDALKCDVASRFRYRHDRAGRADVELRSARRHRARGQSHRAEDGSALRRFWRRRCKSDHGARAIARHASRSRGPRGHRRISTIA